MKKPTEAQLKAAIDGYVRAHEIKDMVENEGTHLITDALGMVLQINPDLSCVIEGIPAPAIEQDEQVAGLLPEDRADMAHIFTHDRNGGIADLIGSYEKSGGLGHESHIQSSGLNVQQDETYSPQRSRSARRKDFDFRGISFLCDICALCGKSCSTLSEPAALVPFCAAVCAASGRPAALPARACPGPSLLRAARLPPGPPDGTG